MIEDRLRSPRAPAAGHSVATLSVSIVGRRLEAQRRPPHGVVEPAVAERDAAGAHDAGPAPGRAARGATPRTSKMSAKSLAKASDSAEIDRLRAVVGERDPLAQGAVAQIDRAGDMDGVLAAGRSGRRRRCRGW